MRLQRALKILEEKELQCGIVLKPENIYYLTGFFPSSRAVLILKSDPVLLISKMDSTRAEEINIEYHIVEKFEKELKELRCEEIAVEKNYITLSFFEKYLNNKIVENLELEEMRSIKDKAEIREIMKAIKIAEKALEGLSLEGRTEREVSAVLGQRINLKADLAFKPIVASGRNSSRPHHNSSDKKIRRGETVIVDLGARVNYYNCDLTRTYLTGEKKEYLDVYEAVLEAQKAAIAECYSGNEIRRPDEVARSVLREYDLAESFLHSTGHGVGLEVHEMPVVNGESKGAFKSGMVVTIEPGVYKEFGVRIEDMVLIGEKPKLLTTIKK